jgi:uncharacterized protein with ParB-like and HNH nuclease domain
MTTNDATFQSGQDYPLSKIFSGKNKIVIPDLQRDYCWGDKARNEDSHCSELVSGFVENLIDIFNNRKNNKLILGLIYGYECPKHYIQLCDGQQRITTLFLLLGILNRKTNGKFKNYLISRDDKEPYLQYAIRESTLYFLSDLVCNYFLRSRFSVNEIQEQDWYFVEYNLDASIQSMIAAIKIIETKLSEIPDFNCVEFGNFVVSNLQILYYDMDNRAQGEETFVVINTSGEPLTATENLKPIIITAQPKESQKKCSELWEEWEMWFWKYRRENNTADNGFKEFFRWIILLNTNDKDLFETVRENGKFKPADIKTLNLKYEDIDNYFQIVKFLFEESTFKTNLNWLAPKDEDGNNQIILFQILPVIKYVKRFGLEIEARNITRVNQFFKNLSRIGNVSKAVGELLARSISIINELPNSDIASIVDVKKVSDQILSNEEKEKFTLYRNPKNDRITLEDVFWRTEEHDIWSGEILPLIHYATKNNSFDFAKFERYNNVFNILFHDGCDYPELDITRRALLTRNLKEYPKHIGKNWSFRWEFSDWKVLIRENEEAFGIFLEELIGKEDIYQALTQMIKKYRAKSNPYYEFVKRPELLEFCGEKNIQDDNNDEWILIPGTRFSSNHSYLKSYLLYLDLQDQAKLAGWKISAKDTCISLHKKNITIVASYEGEDKYQLQVFPKNRENEYDKTWLKNIRRRFKLEKNDSKYEFKRPREYDSIKNNLFRIISSK